MLTREELVGKSPVELENMLRKVVSELNTIRARHGGTLERLPASEVGHVRRLNGEMTMLGEAIDEQRAGNGADRLFEHYDRVLNEVDSNPPDGFVMRHPGTSGGAGSPITRETAVLEANQSFAEWTRVHDGGAADPRERLSFGQWIKAVVTGDTIGLSPQLKATLGEGSIATGGALVPAPLSSELIDLARSKARVIEAGARTVPMRSQTLAIARLASDPGSAWKAESAAVAVGPDPAFERVTLTARTIIAHVKASRELIADAVNMETALRSAFAESIALKIDKAALYGSGVAPEPRGVKNTAGITTVSMGANGLALTNYDPLVNQAQALWDANFDFGDDVPGAAYILAPRTKGSIAKLKDTTNQPLRPPDDIADVRRLETTQVPVNLTQGTAVNASDLFAADWRELLMGVRTSLEVEVLRERYAADTFDVGFLAHARVDFQLARPAAFHVTVGIIP